MSPPKALEAIGASLQKQYERWQPRARYKLSLDPTVDDVKKLCTSLRRNAKEERVLLHYNGHGVPKPTKNGEIWVFNKTYTQYIPLSIYDLQTWMGAPSIYVYDCSNAGIIVDSFKQFADQHQREYEQQQVSSTARRSSPILVLPGPSFRNCIQLASCAADQTLPMLPDLPADLFTACLTTPIKVALRWYVMQPGIHLVPNLTLDLIDKIPGQLNDRRTMLGELNWIFTAITDTIAWNTLPRDLFQKLFRQDLLVASLFRHFLLAERVLRSYDCTPISNPPLPPTHRHHLWDAWDLVLDDALRQLRDMKEKNREYENSTFFEHHLTTFDGWVQYTKYYGGKHRKPPEQLPIILQVLLSQVHRMRALELLAKFLDLGPWAVNLALSVGIFPYVLKLLQSSAKELRPLLVFIWAKILALDTSCQNDLVKDNGHKYFLAILQDTQMSFEHRTLAAFALSCIVLKFPTGQKAALQSGLVSVCLEHLNEPSPKLRQWLALCLARLWENYDQARWCGVRDSAHEKLYVLLDDHCPEVRAAAVYALGTFINSVKERSEHANTIDQQVAMTLHQRCREDMSWLVRRELVCGVLHWMVRLFESGFVMVAALDERKRDLAGFEIVNLSSSTNSGSPNTGSMKRISSRDKIRLLSPSNLLSPDHAGGDSIRLERIKRVASSSSISSMSTPSSSAGGSTLNTPPSIAYGSVYMKLWNALLYLDNDPHPMVSQASLVITTYVRNLVKTQPTGREMGGRESDARGSASLSLPPSPNRSSFLTGNSPPKIYSPSSTTSSNSRGSQIPSRTRKSTVPNTICEEIATLSLDDSWDDDPPLVKTQYVAWASKQFAQPLMEVDQKIDRESDSYYDQYWRYDRNENLRKDSVEEVNRMNSGMLRIESQVFTERSPHPPTTCKFHPYEQQIAIAGTESFSIWDWSSGSKLCSSLSKGTRISNTRITSLEFVNAHDLALLLVACDDGTIKLWRPHTVLDEEAHNNVPTLVTAWQALSDMQPPSRTNAAVGLVMKWEQHCRTLIATGDVRYIRLWDSEKELRVLDLPTGADTNATCVESDNEHLIVVSCGDGSVRVFDRRLASHESRINTWTEHSAWVLTCSLREDGQLVTGSLSGEVKIFDLRQSTSVLTHNTASAMTAMSVHNSADTFASGSINQSLCVYRLSTGEVMNTVKFHEGFMGPRIGPVRCLSYHPYRVALAAGSMDCSVSVYSVEAKR